MAKKPFSIKVEEHILKELKVIAKKELRSVNNTIEVGLNEYVKNYKK